LNRRHVIVIEEDGSICNCKLKTYMAALKYG